MEYRSCDRSLDAARFLEFVSQVWPGEYDLEKTRDALTRTWNITAYDAERLPEEPAVLYHRSRPVNRKSARILEDAGALR